jgi:hypothetical protein
MLKNLLIAILVAILLTYSLGYIASDLFDIQIQLDDRIMTPLASMAVLTGVAVLLVIAGFIVAVSVFGVLFFIFSAIFAGILIVGISAFWPMLIVVAVVLWLVKDKPAEHY